MTEIRLAGFKYSYVHVIESLPDGHHTGRQLRTALQTQIANPVGLRYDEVHTRVELFTLLEKIGAGVSVEGEIPVLHLECHGSDDKDGLILSSNQFVSWKDLWGPLARINTRCALHVLLVLGACYGANFIRAIDPQDRAPVWGILSDPNDFLAGGALDAFPVFYETLFSTQDLAKALVGLRGAGLKDFDVFAAGQMFVSAYRAYMKLHCSDAALTKRAAAASRKSRVSFRQALAAYKLSSRPMFERDRDTFFMFDLFPENHERFQVSYEDVKP